MNGFPHSAEHCALPFSAELCGRLSTAADVPSMHAALGDAIGALGATVYAATGVSPTPQGKAFRTFSNHTKAQWDVVNTPETAMDDPLNQYLRANDGAVYWDQEFYDKAGQLDMWQEQADHGPTHGVAIALKLPADQVFVLAMDWYAGTPLTLGRRPAALNAIQVLACCTYPALTRLWSEIDEAVTLKDVSLSKRERVCLSWSGRGLTDQLVGKQLGISHRTVRKHIDAATKKLGASSRTQAVAVATRLRLLEASDTASVVHVNPNNPPKK